MICGEINFNPINQYSFNLTDDHNCQDGKVPAFNNILKPSSTNTQGTQYTLL